MSMSAFVKKQQRTNNTVSCSHHDTSFPIKVLLDQTKMNIPLIWKHRSRVQNLKIKLKFSQV